MVSHPNSPSVRKPLFPQLLGVLLADSPDLLAPVEDCLVWRGPPHPRFCLLLKAGWHMGGKPWPLPQLGTTVKDHLSFRTPPGLGWILHCDYITAQFSFLPSSVPFHRFDPRTFPNKSSAWLSPCQSLLPGEPDWQHVLLDHVWLIIDGFSHPQQLYSKRWSLLFYCSDTFFQAVTAINLWVLKLVLLIFTHKWQLCDDYKLATESDSKRPLTATLIPSQRY